MTKVVYTFKEYTDPTDIIISIDDDIIYHKELIEELLEGHTDKPDTVLGFMGNNPPYHNYIHGEHIQHGHVKRIYEEVKTLGGYRAILYPRRCIGREFNNILEELNETHQTEIQTNILEDDTFMAKYIKMKGISLYVIGTMYPGNIYSPNLLEQLNFKFLESSNIGNLYGNTNREKMKRSFEIINDYFEKRKLVYT